MATKRNTRAKRRGNGEGSIYFEAASDRWRAALTMDDGRTVRLSARTREEVASKLQALQADLLTGRAALDRTQTVAGLLTYWLEEVLPARGSVHSTNTIDKHGHIVRKHLIPGLGKYRLADLKADHIERFYRSKAERYARSTLVEMRTTLSLALTYAERHEMVGRNVARIAELPAKTKPKAERRSLTHKEATALLQAVKDHRLEALVITAIMLGLRPGELLGLRWEDVDLDGGVLHVRQTLKVTNDPSKPKGERQTLALGPTKTKASRRSLGLPTPVVAALRHHKGRQSAERLAAGPEWANDLGLVFTTASGRPINPAGLRHYFERWGKAAGIGGDWKPYEMRHTAVSLLSDAGVPIEQIADLAGHTTTRMVETVYRHRVTPTVGAAVSPMQRLFAAG